MISSLSATANPLASNANVPVKHSALLNINGSLNTDSSSNSTVGCATPGLAMPSTPGEQSNTGGGTSSTSTTLSSSTASVAGGANAGGVPVSSSANLSNGVATSTGTAGNSGGSSSSSRQSGRFSVGATNGNGSACSTPLLWPSSSSAAVAAAAAAVQSGMSGAGSIDCSSHDTPPLMIKRESPYLSPLHHHQQFAPVATPTAPTHHQMAAHHAAAMQNAYSSMANNGFSNSG